MYFEDLLAVKKKNKKKKKKAFTCGRVFLFYEVELTLTGPL
jgi:hypothetical protein